MKIRLVFSSLLLLALFLALSPTALASTTWYVDGVHGSDHNSCKSPQSACRTIGHAISLASSGDSIMVAAATYTESLNVSVSLKILGSGATTTIINGGRFGHPAVVTISSATAHVALSKLTIQHGKYGDVVGIFNAGTLTISESTIRHNASAGLGGGIQNVGTLTINRSLIAHNIAFSFCIFGHCYYSRGGGIFNTGTLTINNSTISGNAEVGVRGVGGVGGGIDNEGTLTINNSTVSGNSAPNGGGIYGSATFQNSIVANSPSGGNCSGTMTSHGYNLSSDGTCNFNGPGDLNNTRPKLGTLGNYGGPTQTIPLLEGSPAIDAGNPAGCTDGKGHLLKTDQRGKPRPDKEDKSGCDMGAFERQSD